MFLLLSIAAAVAANEPDPDPDPAAFEDALTALQAEVDALRLALLLQEAEAAAATAPEPTNTVQSRASAFNPALTVFGDALTSVGFRGGGVRPGSGPWLRSLELDLRAAVDPYASAVAVLAVHQDNPLEDRHDHEHGDGDEEAGAFHVAPEEVYVDFVALPAGFSARVGQYLQPFGVVNRSHPHDWPWPDMPEAIADILGPEGYADAGGQVTWRAPTPATGLSFTAGALRGTLLDSAEEVATPGWIGRGEWFHEVGLLDLGLGLSGTGLNSERVLGTDLTVRLNFDRRRSLLVLVEGLTNGTDRGGYAAVQIQPVRPLYLGLRGDVVADEKQLGAYASWYTSEFLRVRAGATGGGGSVTAHAQLTFVWGSHPVEPYWVNR